MSKALLLACFIILFISCRKEDTVLPVATVNPPPAVQSPPPFQSSFSYITDNSFFIASGIELYRSASQGKITIAGIKDSAKVEIVVEKIYQSGNNTGVILISFYDVNYYEKTAETGYTKFKSRNERLGIYNDRPLTDSIVSGTFSAEVSADDFVTVKKISGGNFVVRF
jgi:hypothetical protein